MSETQIPSGSVESIALGAAVRAGDLDQVVVVETGGRPVVGGGDVAVWFGELDEPQTEGQLRVRARPRAGLARAHARTVATPHRLTRLYVFARR